MLRVQCWIKHRIMLTKYCRDSHRLTRAHRLDIEKSWLFVEQRAYSQCRKHNHLHQIYFRTFYIPQFCTLMYTDKLLVLGTISLAVQYISTYNNLRYNAWDTYTLTHGQLIIVSFFLFVFFCCIYSYLYTICWVDSVPSTAPGIPVLYLARVIICVEFHMFSSCLSGFFQVLWFSPSLQKHACVWACCHVMAWRPYPGCIPASWSLFQCSRDRLWSYHGPEQDKALTEDELINKMNE